jgi:DNA-directed RNA polymerase subunit RPC12/RpoP
MNLFSDDKAHPIALFLAALKITEHKQEEVVTWSSEVFAHEINKKITPTIISNTIFNKIMAVKTLLVTDAIWEHWELFLNMFHSLNGLPLSREVLHLTEYPLPYLYNTVDIMNIIREQPFSEEVSRFCATVFLHENVQYAPEPLDFCQIFISQPKYKCNNCGKEGSALPPFNYVCSSCAKTFDVTEKDRIFNFKPIEVSKETTDVSISLTYPISNIRTRYEECLNKECTLEENDVDSQVAKLLISHEYVKEQNNELLSEISKYKLL